MRRFCDRLSSNAEWTEWWKSTGYGALVFWLQSIVQKRPDELGDFGIRVDGDTLGVGAFLDLSATNHDDPTLAAEGARRNLETVLDKTAEVARQAPPAADPGDQPRTRSLVLFRILRRARNKDPNE